MNKEGTECAYVDGELPKCSFCEDRAKYDGKTIYGSWAYMCEKHFKEYGVGLGVGRGQRLRLGER